MAKGNKKTKSSNKNQQELLRISKNLNRVRQEVRLSSFDNVIIASIFFFIALYLTLIFSGALEALKGNIFLWVGFLYLIIPAMGAFIITILYVSSIISAWGRFSKKVDSLSYIWGTILFVVEVWVFLFVVYLSGLVAPNFIWPKLLVTVIMFILVLLSFLFTSLKIHSWLKNYFRRAYPLLISKPKKRKNG